LRPEEAHLADFLSGNPHRILDACGVVIAMTTKDDLRYLANNRSEIEKATAPVDLGGGIISGETHLKQALRKLRVIAENRDCLCSIYDKWPFSNPEQEAAKAAVKILKKQVFKHKYYTIYTCECSACGQLFEVTDNIGWHVPTFTWKKINNP